jgi:hypothetical protein
MTSEIGERIAAALERIADKLEGQDKGWGGHALPPTPDWTNSVDPLEDYMRRQAALEDLRRQQDIEEAHRDDDERAMDPPTGAP